MRETVINCFKKCGFRHLLEADEPDPSMSGEDDMYDELQSTGAERPWMRTPHVQYAKLGRHRRITMPRSSALLGKASEKDGDEDEEVVPRVFPRP